MRRFRGKKNILRFFAVASAVVIWAAVIWPTDNGDRLRSQSTVPATGALQRSITAAPVEFDALLKNRASGRCLDVSAYAFGNDHPVQQWDCSDTENQRVWADSVAGSTAHRLHFKHSGKCLEPAEPVAAGQQVRQWVCHSGDYQRPSVDAAAQHWYLNSTGPNEYNIIHVNTGLALTSSGAANGDIFKVAPWTGADAQRFGFESVNSHNTAPAEVGSWGKLIAWPHVPVHAAVTPDNHLVTWASNERDDYAQSTNGNYSWSSVYNLANDSFVSSNNTTHDMFCAGTTLLENGNLLASGGNPRAFESSLFDVSSKSWSLDAYMSQQRWYGTNVVTGSGDVLSSFAKGAQQAAELYSVADGSWRTLPGADMTPLRDEQDTSNSQRLNASAELQWYSFMHTSPDGRVFQSGPMKNMHWFDVAGQGGVQGAGTRAASSRNRQFGSAVMYDVGKLLLSGGSDPTVDDQLSRDGRGILMGATRSAMTIDISGAAPEVQAVASMNERRANHNAVVLPNGEVYVVGGTEWGLLFDDHYSTWWPEIWNPSTRQWRNAAALSTPRNYHSWAILLQDGRVMVGGGGLCGDCSSNHPDAQIYSPPYLYKAGGVLATRPQITAADVSARVGGVLSFTTDTPISAINLVRLSSVTHSINTDQRFIPLDIQQMGEKLYAATLSSNVNVLIPGMYWAFAIDQWGVPSEGHLLQLRTTDALAYNPLSSLTPSGGLQFSAGGAVHLDIPTEDFDSGAVVVSAMGLPQGLALDQSAAVISGSLQAEGEGSFIISLSDGSVQRTERIGYTVKAATTKPPPTSGQGGAATTGGGGAAGAALLILAMIGFSRRAR